jgi:adenylate kinase
MPKVVYLTGAPAAGKSSTTRLLAERVPDLLIWEYGARLTEHVAARLSKVGNQNELRARSSGLVTPSDVEEMDRRLLTFVDEHRNDNHVLIDSHAVTKEAYGYRITPFSLAQFARLAPNEIWVLYATPEETRRRIADDSGGRPLVTEEEARRHTYLQASVAATYGMALGCPVYLFDTGTSRDELISRLQGRLS